MNTHLSRFLVAILLFANFMQSFAQYHTVHEIDSVMDLSPYYLPTYYSKMRSIEFEPLVFKPIDTSMITTHLFSPLLKPENICNDLGINGQAHKSLIFNYNVAMGFNYQNIPYPLYFKNQSDLIFHRLQTTYSKIAYTFGLPKENEFYAEFVKYIKGVTLDFNLYATDNKGTFVNQKSRNICGNFLLHYQTPSSIYGFKASGIVNHLNNAENGGLLDINSYQERLNTSNVDYPVNSPNATSTIMAFDFALHNYVNTINKNKRYFGTFSHDFQFRQTTLVYQDKFDTIYLNYGTYDSENVTNDSTRIVIFQNALQWSNFMPYQEMSNKNRFFHIAGGVLHDYANLKYSNKRFNSFYLFARTHIRFFKALNLTARISYSFSGYTQNDLTANAEISWTINSEKNHIVGFNANFYRNSPEYFMQHVRSNHFRWDTLFSKQNIVQLKLFWNYEKYIFSVSYYNINNFVYLTELFRPIQNNNIGNMIQVSTFLPFRFKNFGTTANLNLQYCTHDVIKVPLFAGKLSIFYIFEFLKKRLKIQIGTDVMYHTAYYADAYLPVLHTFYSQNSQHVGNFIFWDANVTFQIDRINFFFRIGNLLPPLMHYRNITTPNYPTKEYLISLGITWRFFD